MDEGVRVEARHFVKRRPLGSVGHIGLLFAP